MIGYSTSLRSWGDFEVPDLECHRLANKNWTKVFPGAVSVPEQADRKTFYSQRCSKKFQIGGIPERMRANSVPALFLMGKSRVPVSEERLVENN